MVHPSAFPDNALQLPTSEGHRHERHRGTDARREPGAQSPRPRRRRLTFPMLAPGPSHMDFYNLTSPWPRAAGRSRSRRRSASEPEREEEEPGGKGGREGGRAPLRGPGPGAGPGGTDGRGGGTRRSPETRARAAQPERRSTRLPARQLRALARSLAAALTHIPSIPEEPPGGPELGRERLRGGSREHPVRAWCGWRGSPNRLLPGGRRLEAPRPHFLSSMLLPRHLSAKAAKHYQTSQVASAMAGAGMALGGGDGNYQFKLQSFPYSGTLPLSLIFFRRMKGFHKIFTFLFPQGKERMEDEGREQEKNVSSSLPSFIKCLLCALQCTCIVPFKVEGWCLSSFTLTHTSR